MQQTSYYIEVAFASGNYEECLTALKKVKMLVIGSKKQKMQAVEMGLIPKLIHFMIEDDANEKLMVESAIILNSLAKCGEDTVAKLVDSGAFQVLLKGLCHSCKAYSEACLVCVKTILSSPNAPTEILYQDPEVVPHLIHIMNTSHITKSNVSSIFAACCKSDVHQTILLKHNILESLWPLISSRIPCYQIPAVKCLMVLVDGRKDVALEFCKFNCREGGKYGQCEPLVEMVMARECSVEYQLTAAKCLTKIYRAGALDATDEIIHLKVLGTLVSFCEPDVDLAAKVQSGHILYELAETGAWLQKVASISNHLVANVATFLKTAAALTASQASGEEGMEVDDEQNPSSRLKECALNLFSVLAANDEDIRKKILETSRVMEEVVYGLSDPSRHVQIASLRCVLSLTRSAQQLRTVIQDHVIYKPILRMLKNCEDGDMEMMRHLSAVLCNLVIDFSACREALIKEGVIGIVTRLTNYDELVIKIQGVWALVNLAFQASEEDCELIMTAIRPDQIFDFLTSASRHSGVMQEVVGGEEGPQLHTTITIKSLTLLRNLLALKYQIIEDFLTKHSVELMSILLSQLKDSNSELVLNQVLCLLCNIASWEGKKSLIMDNEQMLAKLVEFVKCNITELQASAVMCIHNLVWNEEEGASERQAILKEMGAPKALQQLLQNPDQALCDKAKSVIQIFNTT